MKGFTLIELLVVVLIIGILSAVALPKYQAAVQKTKFMTLVPLVKDMVRQQDIYFMETGTYAQNFEEMPDLIPPGYVFLGNTKGVIWNNNFKPAKLLLLSSQSVVAEPLGSGFCQYQHDYTAIGGKRFCRSYQGACNRLCASLGGGNPRTMGGGWVVFDLP